MLINRVRLAGDSKERPYFQISQEDAELVDKALYTGHAVFWENEISMQNAEYPELNKIPGNQVKQEEILVE